MTTTICLIIVNVCINTRLSPFHIYSIILSIFGTCGFNAFWRWYE